MQCHSPQCQEGALHALAVAQMKSLAAQNLVSYGQPPESTKMQGSVLLMMLPGNTFVSASSPEEAQQPDGQV